jgi:multiple sugar transport system ATP-binding protein
MNLVDAVVEGDTVRFGPHTLPLAAGRRPARRGRVVLGVRPEAFEDARFASPSLPTMDVDVTVLEELGADLHAIFALDVPPVRTDDVREAADDDEALLLADRTICTARIDVQSPVRPGDRLTLAVDPRHFHFFDAESGENVTGAAELVAV